MRLLVTGSSGYVGSALVPLLADRGFRVVGFDRRAPAAELAARLERSVVGDLGDEGLLADALGGVDGVVHLAAAKDDWGISDAEYLRDNTEVTERLIRAGRAAGVGDWLFFSTVSVIGPGAEPLDESAPMATTNAYGESKARAERLFVRLVEEEPACRVVVLRPSAIYGPGHDTNIYRLVESVRARRFVMIGRGDAVKSLSYLENVNAAALFLLDRLRPGLQTYIYVDEPVLSTRELVTRIHWLLGRRPPRWHLPLGLVRPLVRPADAIGALVGVDFAITAARIEKFCTATHYDPSALRRLGFRPPVTVDEALRRTVEWHRGHRGAVGAAPG